MPYPTPQPFEFVSDQAEANAGNPGAAAIQMRILTELQVISFLLSQMLTESDKDLRALRQECSWALKPASYPAMQ